MFEDGLIDFHAHILPKADHGSDGVEMSLMQLKKAEDAGIKTIVATSHFYPYRHSVSHFVKKRDAAYKELQKQDLSGIRIVKAAEVFLTTDLPELPELEKLCIDGTRYILLEMPTGEWTHWVYDAVYHIACRQLLPIIAHVDRYKETDVRKLLALDAIGQVNADAIAGFFTRKRYMKMIDEGLVHLLGSDVHMNGIQYDLFKKSVTVLKDKTGFLMDNARKVLAGERIK